MHPRCSHTRIRHVVWRCRPGHSTDTHTHALMCSTAPSSSFDSSMFLKWLRSLLGCCCYSGGGPSPTTNSVCRRWQPKEKAQKEAQHVSRVPACRGLCEPQAADPSCEMALSLALSTSAVRNDFSRSGHLQGYLERWLWNRSFGMVPASWCCCCCATAYVQIFGTRTECTR